MHKKVLLIILDGWGIAGNKAISAIAHAKTPFIDSLCDKNPHSALQASGLAVGLPKGQMGNSEVGHMNIGAGRIVDQNLVRINKTIDNKELEQNNALLEAFSYAKKNKKNIHFMGLVSNGGVHSHINHLKAILSLAHQQNANRVFVHAFMDGRDADPYSGISFLTDLQSHMDKTTGQLATVIGRYFAMDRDNRWGRTKCAYDAMVSSVGEHTQDIQKTIEQSYKAGVSDEFINPIIATDKQSHPIASIKEGDMVLCFNFRSDRNRQIIMALTQQDFPTHKMQMLNLHCVTMTCYDETFKNIYAIFEKSNLTHTLGEIISLSGKKQIRIAETEKYPHVTFFFSGGREAPYAGETRILCPSPKVPTYDLEPNMSAKKIRDEIIPELEKRSADFVCLNFANPDMVGHTGVFAATVQACETVDRCTKAVTEVAVKNGYGVIIIADHGNADVMINKDQSPHTQHTQNPVPCILIDNHYKGQLHNGNLSDIAPTILTLMGLPIPAEMSGSVLIDS